MPPRLPRDRKDAKVPGAGAMAKHWKGNASFGTVGLEIVLSMLVGLFGGRWLDGRFGSAPWLAMLGFAFGLAAGGKSVWRAFKDMQAVTAREEQEQGNPPPKYGPDERPRDVERSSGPVEDGDGAPVPDDRKEDTPHDR